MKKEIDLISKKPKLAYVGMEKITAVEAVPTQVIIESLVNQGTQGIGCIKPYPVI